MIRFKFSSEDNFEHNKNAFEQVEQNGKSPYSEDGFIEEQNLLSNIRYGAQTSDYAGCGWIAVWNVLKSMNIVLSKCRVICDMEQGVLFAGNLGTEIFFVKRYLESLGHNVKMYCSKNKFDGCNSNRGIIYYTRKNLSAHYAAYEFIGHSIDGEPMYRFHNAEAKAGARWKTTKGVKRIVAPVLTIDEFLDRSEAVASIFYDVKN
ncbi:MAG: hypothetical protein ACI4IW_05445 [Oscillospiraceae bacterium]